MINRKKIIAGNWKMNKTQAEARVLVEDLLKDLGRFDTAEIVLCPPYTALAAVSEMLSSPANASNIRLGAQNLHEAPPAPTPVASPPACSANSTSATSSSATPSAASTFKEDNFLINRKTKAALAAELRPIVCIGETLPEREAGRVEKRPRNAVAREPQRRPESDLANVTLAYEPVWAIGTGKTATPAQAEEAHQWIRHIVADRFTNAAADKIRIQYGGSVKAENAKELLSSPTSTARSSAAPASTPAASPPSSKMLAPSSRSRNACCPLCTGRISLIYFLLTVYVLDCAFMGLVIMMQRSKQEGLGAAFGGGFTESVFGAQTSNVLVKATVWARDHLSSS